MYNVSEIEKKIYSDIMHEIKEIRKKTFEDSTKCSKRVLKKTIPNGYEHVIDEDANYFSDDKIAIYTCIIGDYDKLREPYFVPNNCDFYVITDASIDKNSNWKKIDPYSNNCIDKSWNPTKINRYCKMHPCDFFEDYRYSIYLDGSYEIFTDLTEFVNDISEYGMAFFRHPDRTCVYDEIKVCIKLKKDKKEILLKQKEYLRNKGIKENYGLVAAGIIARDHHNDICKKVMSDWWVEYIKYSQRDQISLISALYDNSIMPEEISTLKGGVFSNCSVDIGSHLIG